MDDRARSGRASSSADEIRRRFEIVTPRLGIERSIDRPIDPERARDGRATMVLLENDAFLTELTKLYERTRAKGSVSCMMKITKPTNKPRPKGTKRPDPTLEEIRAPGSEYGVLVRASDGKRKVSTFVKPEKASKFSKSYQTIQLAYLDGLSAETKKKKKKPTAKAKKPTAKAKKPVEESTVTPAAPAPAPAPAKPKPKPTATPTPTPKPKPPPGAKGAKKKGAGARK